MKKIFINNFHILNKKINYILIIFFSLNIVNFLNKNKKWIISNLNNIIEIKKIDNYLKYCNNFKTNLIKEYKNKNPKISIISPIYNRKLYILRFLKSIQNQNFQDLEIILVDDCSIDDSLEIINIYSKRDKRIIIMKNKIRKGTFLTRNIGVLYSKGKYITIPDPDDLIGKNILSMCYKYAEVYKYDIIRFNIYEGQGMIKDNELSNENHCLKQPSLSTSIFYANNVLGKKKTDYNIYNKFIKKEIYIMSLNSLNKYYLNMYLTIGEDQLLNYVLYRTAKSLYFLKNIGYYYFLHNMSITKSLFQFNILIPIFNFVRLKFIFENSKNTKFEKDMANFVVLNLLNNNNFSLKINYKDKKYKFFLFIINMYLNSKYITNSNKFLLLKIKNMIIK